jgi:hypothetical protein
LIGSHPIIIGMRPLGVEHRGMSLARVLASPRAHWSWREFGSSKDAS